jgi:hypothetical protein
MEAGLQYFESLRMARIVNLTWHDPNTLNVELNDFTNNFDDTVKAILRHTGLLARQPEKEEMLLNRLRSYDKGRQGIYAKLLSSQWYKHTTTAPPKELRRLEIMARQDVEISALFRPISNLLPLSSRFDDNR